MHLQSVILQEANCTSLVVKNVFFTKFDWSRAQCMQTMNRHLWILHPYNWCTLFQFEICWAHWLKFVHFRLFCLILVYGLIVCWYWIIKHHMHPIVDLIQLNLIFIYKNSTTVRSSEALCKYCCNDGHLGLQPMKIQEDIDGHVQ